MKKITYLINGIIRYALLCIILLSFNAGAQVYLHDFGTAAISSHPYNVAPATLSADLSGSSWTNSTGEFTSFSGASGVALSLANSGGTPTITLTFNVNAGKALDLTSFSFWRVRSGAGAQNWSMTINGITVGNGSVPTTGASTGTLPANLTGLTGTVRVVLSLSGATGSGTFRLDDFRLNGTTRSSCAGATISSISPLSGPENTIVSIIGSGFETGAGTTGVQFNGMNAAGFTVISDTEIKAIVPALATSGAISVTTNGCTANFSTFTAINSNCPLLSGGTDIYISEVYDQKTGSGGMIEIYNPTNNTITLTGNYILQRYGNITDTTPSTGYILPLTGTIAPGATYLVAANEPDATICAAPPYNITYTSGFNANDKFELLKNNTVIDVVNVPFLQTGFTLIRRPDAAAPSPVYNIVDWNNFLHDDVEPNTYCANLGIHDANNSQPPVTIIAQPLSLSVCESNNASFTVVMTNATGFTIQWKVLNAAGNWVNVVNDNHYSGANSTTLTITDAPLDFLGNQYYAEAVNGNCRLVSNAVQLTVSPLPVVLAVPTNPTCFISVGSITVVPLFGVGLTYSLDGVNFQAAATFSNLAPGTYTISVRTLAGCISTTDITIADIPLLPAVPTLVVTQPTCTVNTGSIEITAPLGLGITFSIDGQNFQAGNTFTGLAAGNYTITVQTALGCLATLPVTVNPAPVLALPVVNIVQPTCTSPTGTINVTGPLGLDLTYSLDGTNFQAGTAFSGLATGNYTLTVKSNAGCIATIPVTITPAPLAPVLPVFTVTQPTCTTTTGSITITGPIGGGSLTYSINGTTFQADTSFTNLAPGSYTITVLNGDGCTSVSSPVSINPVPTAPAAPTVAATQPTCTTAGTITISAPTGNGFTYSINGTDYAATTTFTPGAGTYNVTVRNSDGCTSTATPVTINAAPTAPAAPTVAATQPTCTTAGTITISAPTGNGFTYSINGTDYAATTTFTPGAGTYNVTVRNSDGCTSTATPVTINPVPTAPAAPTVAAIQPTCTTAGTITISAPTGNGFTYSINGTDYAATTTFTPGAGTYNVTVRNSDGCTSTATPVTINPVPTAPAAPTVAATQPTCTTAGTITISAPTGNGFTYSINGTDYAATTIFTPGAGTYNVTVRNSDGCTSTATPVTINPVPTAPAAPTVAATQPTCTTAGTITISAPTGNGFTYSINGTDYAATTTFTPGAGTYNVTVRNSDGCTSTATPVTINAAPTAPAAPTVAAIQPTCTTAGTITISAPTGNGFTYSINGTDYAATTTFTPGAGTYNVTVRNSDGCTSAATPVTINVAPTAPVAPTVAATQPTCTTAGTITISAPTGNGFTYSINGTDYAATTTFTPGAGTYNVTVRNAAGCTSVATPVTISPVPTAPAAPTVAATQPTCTTAGTITISAPTGNGFTYSINGTDYAATTTFTPGAGTYNVTVRNSDGCTSAATPVTINPVPTAPAAPTVAFTQPTCTTAGTITISAPTGNGFTYSINGTDYAATTTFTPGAGTYNVTVRNSDGCTSAATPVTINPVPTAPAAPTVAATQPTCTITTGSFTITGPVGNDFTYSIDGGEFTANTTYTNLQPGIYSLVVKNSAGCTTSNTVTITEPEIPVVGQVSIAQPTCTEPTAILTVNTPQGTGWTYSIDGSNFQQSSSFLNLDPGTYTITVKNPEGCISEGAEYVINDIPGLPLISSVEGCRDTAFSRSYIIEALPLNNSFDTATAQYIWRDTAGTIIGNDQSTFDVSKYIADNNISLVQSPLQIVLTVTSEGGCSATMPFTVESIFCTIPKGISPNNDGKNDKFDLAEFNISQLSIFNRYGKEVFTRSNYKDEWMGQSDGGDELPTGTYYYVIEVPGREAQTGWVYVNREESSN
jgi:gliding motility-associated-like protein